MKTRRLMLTVLAFAVCTTGAGAVVAELPHPAVVAPATGTDLVLDTRDEPAEPVAGRPFVADPQFRGAR